MIAALRLTHDEEVEVRYAAFEQLSALLFSEDSASYYHEIELTEDERGELNDLFWLALGNINAAREHQRPPLFQPSTSF